MGFSHKGPGKTHPPGSYWLASIASPSCLLFSFFGFSGKWHFWGDLQVLRGTLESRNDYSVGLCRLGGVLRLKNPLGIHKDSDSETLLGLLRNSVRTNDKSVGANNQESRLCQGEENLPPSTPHWWKVSPISVMPTQRTIIAVTLFFSFVFYLSKYY